MILELFALYNGFSATQCTDAASTKPIGIFLFLFLPAANEKLTSVPSNEPRQNPCSCSRAYGFN